jgi:hypothetical protein
LEEGLCDVKVENLKLIMRKSDGYVNATKLCKDAGKEYSNWKRLDGSENLLSAFERSLQICRDLLVESITTGINETRGTYVHPKIAIQIANWCSPEFAVKVSDIIFRYYSGDLFLIRDVVQNFNATHEETKVSRVEVTISEEKKLELRERESKLEKEKVEIEERKSKLDQEILERSLALLDLSDPRQKIVADSLKINAVNYFQRMRFPALTQGEEQKVSQELPALSIIVSKMIQVVEKGSKSTIRAALELYTMSVAKIN